MAEIFSVPNEDDVPQVDFDNYNHKEHTKKEDKYLEDLKAELQKLGYNDKETGEIITFPVADGKAIYMVMSMASLRLVHIPFGDAWEFEYVHLLTKKEVKEKIKQGKALAKLFS